MKEIIISENELKNLQSLGQSLFDDENDPRSSCYDRKLERPKPKVWAIAIYLLACAALPIGTILLLKYAGMDTLPSVAVGIALLLVFIAITAKKAVICAVRLYQYLAPDSVRKKCRFEPSCSQYMILAVEKYGVIRGVKKGIGRLRRCNKDNGGFDWP